MNREAEASDWQAQIRFGKLSRFVSVTGPEQMPARRVINKGGTAV